MGILRIGDEQLRVPNEILEEYLDAELQYTGDVLDDFYQARAQDSLRGMAERRQAVLDKRREFYDHWFRTGNLLSPEDSSM